jgi:hypothetical protein
VRVNMRLRAHSTPCARRFSDGDVHAVARELRWKVEGLRCAGKRTREWRLDPVSQTEFQPRKNEITKSRL